MDSTPSSSPKTLGDVLYARRESTSISEAEWRALVRDVAAGHPAALHALYDRSARLVFILAFRIVGSREEAESVVVEVFADVARRAWAYQDESCTVLAWIMNQARTRAREHAGLGTRVNEADARTTPIEQLQLRESVKTDLARRMAHATRPDASQPAAPEWREPEWQEVAPKIETKILASDTSRDRVSMLVRLQPNGEYPPHTHAGLEELHLLEGELWINDQKLKPGDYNRAEAPTGDYSVRSDTGCTCVLITSTRDELR
jgi:anti-sigma factor ChrR (cupin superfamily)